MGHAFSLCAAAGLRVGSQIPRRRIRRLTSLANVQSSGRTRSSTSATSGSTGSCNSSTRCPPSPSPPLLDPLLPPSTLLSPLPRPQPRLPIADRPFSLQYNHHKDRECDKLLWGEEIEYHLMKADKANKTVKLSLRGAEVLEHLRAMEEKSGRCLTP